MRESITISGHPFQVDNPYKEGDELTANEASALNQLRHENLRNNFAGKVKAHVEGGGKPEDLQKEFDTYAASYQFGARTGGGGVSRDPVQSEAMRMAKEVIKQAIKRQGGKPSAYEASAITTAAENFLKSAQGAPVLEEARLRIEAQQKAATDGLGDILAGLTTKPAAEPQQQAAG